MAVEIHLGGSSGDGGLVRSEEELVSGHYWYGGGSLTDGCMGELGHSTKTRLARLTQN